MKLENGESSERGRDDRVRRVFAKIALREVSEQHLQGEGQGIDDSRAGTEDPPLEEAFYLYKYLLIYGVTEWIISAFPTLSLII